MQPGYGQDPHQQQYPPGYGQVPQFPDPTFAPQPGSPYATPPQPSPPQSTPPQSTPPYSAPPAGGQYPSSPAEYSLYPPQPEYAQPQYPQYPQAQYPQSPAYPPAGYTVPPMTNTGQANTFGLLSMIFGIVSIPLLFCCYLGIPLAIAGAVLGVVGVGKANKGQASNKGMAVAGIVCSAATLVILVAIIILYAVGVASLPSTNY